LTVKLLPPPPAIEDLPIAIAGSPYQNHHITAWCQLVATQHSCTLPRSLTLQPHNTPLCLVPSTTTTHPSLSPPPQALVAIQALQEGDYREDWEGRCNNPSAWLMGIMSRALRQHGLT